MLAVGFALGFFGGGGGILTVPVLTYLFLLPAEAATGYSLWVVGITSLAGALRAAFQRSVEVRAGLILLAPSMVVAFSVRRWLIPVIPDDLGRFGGITLTKNAALMLLFAGIMLVVSWRMLQQRPPDHVEGVPASPQKMGLIGVAVGLLAGLVGAGGGFLVVPALVLYAQLNMKKAIGTSLMVISIQSLVGFSGEAIAKPIDWPWALQLALVSAVGLVLGIGLGSRVNGENLKVSFGWFVRFMGMFVLIREGLGLFRAA